MSGLRIGLLSPGWPGTNTANGIATAVRHLASGLIETGHVPVVMTGQIDDTPPEGIAVVRRPEMHWTLTDRLYGHLARTEATRRVAARAFAKGVRKMIQDHGVEIFLMEEGQGWSEQVQKAVDIPVVTVLHGPWVLHAPLYSLGPAEDRRRICREGRAMRRTAGLIAPSRAVLSAVTDAYDLAGVPARVIPNAYAPATAHEPAANAGHDRFLFVGRYDRHKGGDIVLDAFAKLRSEQSDARLTFAGPDRGIRLADGGVRSLAAHLADLPEAVRDSINATGPLSAEEIAGLRRSHGIAIIGSRFENLNYTLLEAMAAGQAIVSTAVGGPAEVLEDKVTALLVPPDDPDAMVTALAKLISDPELARKLGAAAQARVARDFAPAPVATRVTEFLREILARK